LAERGFFCREMNVGIAEWQEQELPTHAGRVAAGELRCSCSHGGAFTDAATPP
jgi:hypothetical protein